MSMFALPSGLVDADPVSVTTTVWHDNKSISCERLSLGLKVKGPMFSVAAAGHPGGLCVSTSCVRNPKTLIDNASSTMEILRP